MRFPSLVPAALARALIDFFFPSGKRISKSARMIAKEVSSPTAHHIPIVLARYPSRNDAIGFVPAQAIAHSAMTLAVRSGRWRTNRVWVTAPVRKAATPATNAAARLTHLFQATAKKPTAMASSKSDQAARLVEYEAVARFAFFVGGRNDPSTVPMPSADRKYPAQTLDAPGRLCATAGPRMRMGSSANVTAATMARKSRIRGRFSASTKPSLACATGRSPCSRAGWIVVSIAAKITNDVAFSKKAQRKPIVTMNRTDRAGASARPRCRRPSSWP